MPLLISEPIRIPVPGGKSIDEYVGRVRTSSENVSVARMVAPAGWTEPAQAPDFDEITLVISGSVHVECAGQSVTVAAGQALITYAGERVRFSTSEPAEYVAICLPAFGPELANRDPE